jgi:cytochrome b
MKGPTARVVWDLPVRLFHWLLVVAVAGCWITLQPGIAAFEWHVRFGYATLVLILFRIGWGFVGSRPARFSSFVRGPVAVWRYVKSLRDSGVAYVGHNPLGALMVLLLLALLLAIAITGLFANDEIMYTGALYGYVSDEVSDRLSHLHHELTDLLWIAIGVHLLAVLAYLFFKRENLVGPMITGHRAGAGEPTSVARLWLAALLAALAGLLLYAVVATAPKPSLILF